MIPCILTIVRHGETEYNKQGTLQGQAIDAPLSTIGEEQAKAAGLHLKDITFTDAFVSDMQRAYQTAEIILKNNQQSHGVKLLVEPLLKERSFGIVEGKPMDMMRTLASEAGQTLPEFTPPQGETMEQVKIRFAAFLENMMRHLWSKHGHGDANTTQDKALHILVVSHGAYMQVILRYMADNMECTFASGVDKTHMYKTSPNTGITRFQFNLRSCNESISLADLNCMFVNQADHVKTGH